MPNDDVLDWLAGVLSCVGLLSQLPQRRCATERLARPFQQAAAVLLNTERELRPICRFYYCEKAATSKFRR